MNWLSSCCDYRGVDSIARLLPSFFNNVRKDTETQGNQNVSKEGRTGGNTLAV